EGYAQFARGVLAAAHVHHQGLALEGVRRGRRGLVGHDAARKRLAAVAGERGEEGVGRLHGGLAGDGARRGGFGRVGGGLGRGHVVGIGSGGAGRQGQERDGEGGGSDRIHRDTLPRAGAAGQTRGTARSGPQD